MLAANVVDQPVRYAREAGQLFQLAAIRLAARIDEVKGAPHGPVGCPLLYRVQRDILSLSTNFEHLLKFLKTMVKS